MIDPILDLIKSQPGLSLFVGILVTISGITTWILGSWKKWLEIENLRLKIRNDRETHDVLLNLQKIENHIKGIDDSRDRLSNAFLLEMRDYLRQDIDNLRKELDALRTAVERMRIYKRKSDHIESRELYESNSSTDTIQSIEKICEKVERLTNELTPLSNTLPPFWNRFFAEDGLEVLPKGLKSLLYEIQDLANKVLSGERLNFLARNTNLEETLNNCIINTRNHYANLDGRINREYLEELFQLHDSGSFITRIPSIRVIAISFTAIVIGVGLSILSIFAWH